MTVWSVAVWSFGAAFGFAVAAFFYLFKQAFVEPVWEAILEWRERSMPPSAIEADLTKPQSITYGETFVISDLHIDTWHRVPSIDEKTQFQHFEDFLDTAKRTALELYINGDLTDMPPHPAEEWAVPTRRPIIPKYAPVFAKLAQFNAGDERSRTMTMYMAGNHDMAASGVRYLLHHGWDLLPKVRLPFQNAWYGHYVISVPYTEETPEARYRYLMEHGHYHDPMLILYLLQFVIGVVSSNLEAAMDSLTVGGQRRRSPLAPAPPPGIVSGKVPEGGEPITHKIVKWRWRWKARRQLGRMNRRAIKAGEEPLDGILMGHTHLPDFYVYRQGGVRGKVYVNTGDWSGDTGHTTYAVISNDGLVYLYDWHSNRPDHHRLRRDPAPSSSVRTGGEARSR